MHEVSIQAERLLLRLRTPEQARAAIDALPIEHREQVSPSYLFLLASATTANPWIHGFELILHATGERVGSAGFKAPPANGSVELAYQVDDKFQQLGYATEAAQALTRFALMQPGVRMVCAHTLPESGPSARVLSKCGFAHIGEVVDPEDGIVWRWEARPGV